MDTDLVKSGPLRLPPPRVTDAEQDRAETVAEPGPQQAAAELERDGRGGQDTAVGAPVVVKER